METQEITIKLREDSLDATVSIKENQKVTTKTVGFDDVLLKIVSNYTLSTGILPRGTRLFSGTVNHYNIVIEIPNKVREVKYEKGDLSFCGQIPFPSCVMIFEVNSGNVCKSSALALQDPISSEQTKLYNFPFGNTYSGGAICWGSVEKQYVRKPLDLLSYVGSFMNSTYNGDLFHSFSFNYSYDPSLVCGDLLSLLKFLDGKEIFPKELLTTANLTLEKVLKNE